MNQPRRLLATIGLLAMLFCLLNVSAYAQEATDVGKFPAYVIEVPQGTEISIDDDAGTVTIFGNPVDISEGDTFVVYLQELPIGYIAKTVATVGNNTVIGTEKADKSIYTSFEEEGVIELTPDMYDFLPAEGIVYHQTGTRGIGGGDGFSYEDGVLKLQKSFGGNTASISLSGLQLSYSASNGDVSLTLRGNWKISTPMLSTSEDVLTDVPMGVLRIGGIGKVSVKLSMSMAMNMSCNFSGTFSVGFSTANGEAGAINSNFSVSDKTVSGRGSITASLKVTAGVDILFAEADIYGEVGVATEVQTQQKTNPVTEETVYCENYRFYIFIKAGAEAKYRSPFTGKMKKLAGYDFPLPDEIATPFSLDVHFENGLLVIGCGQGMNIHFNNAYGGYSTGFGSTLFTDGRERVLETNVDLPWDLEVDGDYRIANGNLNLNGHTLIIHGDLIQSGGTLTIGNGTLIVHGDYRMQSITDGAYGDSTGRLVMNGSAGTINLDGDFVIQTNAESHSMSAGTINIKGNITQINPSSGASHFNSGTGCNFVLSADRTHILRFADAANNSIGWVTFLNDVTSQGNVKLGRVDANGHRFVVNGNFTSTGRIDLQDFDPLQIENLGSLTLTENRSIQSTVLFDDIIPNGYELIVNGDMISRGSVDLNGGMLTVTGTLYQQGGIMNINNGKLIVGGNYYITGSGSNYTTGAYTTANASLRMKNASDEVRISGDFITASSSYSSYSNSNTFTNGVMYIGGNFRQINGGNTSTACANFEASGSHKVVFNGSGRQTIQFDTTSSGFANVEFQNTDIELTGSYLRGFSLNEDINLTLSTHDLTMYNTMDLNGHSLGTNIIEGDFILRGGTIDLDGTQLTVQGDLTITGYNNNTNLNGGILMITGTLYQQDGIMNINNGKLIVGGNYYITGSGSNYTTGAYTTADAGLRMKNASDEVRISGDFITASTNNSSYSNTFTNGVMYIGGNFRQKGTNSDAVANFNASGSHKVVFNGSGRQTIQFDTTSSGFANVEFQNTDIELTGSYLRGFALNEDINLTLSTHDLTMSDTMDLNGHSLGTNIIEGDFILRGGTIDLDGTQLTVQGNLTLAWYNNNTNLNGGMLTVTGTLYQQHGIMNINNGKLIVGGNYYITGSGSNYTTGAYTTADAGLRMKNASDEVRISGDFITASTNNSSYSNTFTNGVMYIGGNFRQINGGTSSTNCANFSASGSHKVIFDGIGKRVVSFDSSSSHFATVEIKQALDMYEFTPNPCWATLIVPEISVFGTPDFTFPAALIEIDDSAFECIVATIVYVPDGCTTIGEYAFRNAAITQIRIPACCSIADTAFDGCEAVQIFGTPGSEAEIFCETHDNCTFIAEEWI